MPTNLLIENVPQEIVEKLRSRGEVHGRTVQDEVLAILEEAVKPRRLTVDEVYEKGKELGLRTGDDSVWMIREDRDSR